MMLIEKTASAKKKIEKLNEEIKKLEDDLLGLYSEREIEKDSLDQLSKKQGQVEKIEEELKHLNGGDHETKFKEYEVLKQELVSMKIKSSEMRGAGKIIINDEVTKNDVATTISTWSGIPLASLLQEEKDKLINMEEILGKMVIGQDAAIVAISKAIRRARAGLKDPSRPIKML